MFKDIRSEIEGLFADAQGGDKAEQKSGALLRQHLGIDTPFEDGVYQGGKLPGFRVYGGRRTPAQEAARTRNTPERKAYKAGHADKAARAKIRDRILAGERPKIGGRGRPPARWIELAKEMGIDLTAPAGIDIITR
jgi:hypothetical protein